MSSAGATLDLVELLPTVSPGRLGVHVVGKGGEILGQSGYRDSLEVRPGSSGPGSSGPEFLVGEDRAFLARLLPQDEHWLILTWDKASGEVLEPFLGSLLSLLTEKEQAEKDMESMYSSSLALLEEVSMVGEMLPRLPTGESKEEIICIGLKALLVAASVECIFYLDLDPQRRQAEILVQVCAEGEELRPVVVVCDLDPVVPEDESILWRALKGQGGAILESVPEGSYLGAAGSPESLASRQVVAVPVRYGAGEKSATLGVILLLDKRPNAYSDSMELGSQETKLATSVATMLGSVLGTRLVAEMGKEMKMAQELQCQILPQGPPKIEGFDLAGRCTTSGDVGGDYFDYLSTPDGRTLAVVADVSGHNLPSGMVMVSARATLRLLSTVQSCPGVIFDQLARSLHEDLRRTERFISAAGLAISPGQKKVELVNAGHNPVMHYSASRGEVVEIYADDTVLGFLAAPEHVVREVEVEVGDVLFIYTDGATEAVDEAGEMFGEERLIELLKSTAGGSAEDILSAVFGAVVDFADRNEKGDDVSAVVVKALS